MTRRIGFGAPGPAAPIIRRVKAWIRTPGFRGKLLRSTAAAARAVLPALVSTAVAGWMLLHFGTAEIARQQASRDQRLAVLSALDRWSIATRYNESSDPGVLRAALPELDEAQRAVLETHDLVPVMLREIESRRGDVLFNLYRTSGSTEMLERAIAAYQLANVQPLADDVWHRKALRNIPRPPPIPAWFPPTQVAACLLSDPRQDLELLAGARKWLEDPGHLPSPSGDELFDPHLWSNEHARSRIRLGFCLGDSALVVAGLHELQSFSFEERSREGSRLQNEAEGLRALAFLTRDLSMLRRSARAFEHALAFRPAGHAPRSRIRTLVAIADIKRRLWILGRLNEDLAAAAGIMEEVALLQRGVADTPSASVQAILLTLEQESARGAIDRTALIGRMEQVRSKVTASSSPIEFALLQVAEARLAQNQEDKRQLVGIAAQLLEAQLYPSAYSYLRFTGSSAGNHWYAWVPLVPW